MEQLYNKKFVYFEWDDELKEKDVFLADTIFELRNYVNCGKDKYKCQYSNNPTGFHFSKPDSRHAYQFCYYDPNYEAKKAFMDGKTILGHFKDKPHDEWFDINKDTFSNGYSLDDFNLDLKLKPEWKVYVGMYNNVPVFNILQSDCDTHCYFQGTYDECHKYCTERKDYPELMYAWENGKTIQFKSVYSWEDIINPAWETQYEYRIKPECKEYVPFDTVQELIDYWDEKHPSNRPSDTLPLIWIKNKDKDRRYFITEYYFDNHFDADVSTSLCELSLKDLFEEYTFLNGAAIGKVKE